MAFPIPGHLQRIDRKHHIAGSQQRLYPRPSLGLNSDQHLIRLGCRIEMLSDQLMQRRDARQPLRQPPPGQHPARLVFDLNVMVGFRPIVANKQHRASPLKC